MHTDASTKEKPTGSANYPVGHTDAITLPAFISPIKSRLIARAGIRCGQQLGCVLTFMTQIGGMHE